MQTLPPYAVRPTEFRYRALTMLAGRLALGGPREIALAVLMAARLAPDALSPERAFATRLSRGAAARAWASALTVPAPVRAALLHVVQAAEDADVTEARRAMDELILATDSVLDVASRGELKRLSLELAASEGNLT